MTQHPSNLTLPPQPIAPADVTAQLALEPRGPQFAVKKFGRLLAPTTLDQVQAAIGQIVRDPFGAVVGIAKTIGADIATIYGVTTEELDDPQIQQRLRQMGIDPVLLVPWAKLTDKVFEGLGEEQRDRLRSGAALGALVAGGTAAGLARRFGVAALGTPTTIVSKLERGVVEAIAFGTTAGTLTPLEEGQTRLGNIITWNVLAVPFATLGGITSMGMQRFLLRKGIKPQLEAPEVTPTGPEFRPQAAVREGAPFVELVGRTTPGGVDLGGRLAKGAKETAVQLEKTLAETVARRDVPGGSVTASEAAMLEKTSIGQKAKPKPFSWDQFYTNYLDDLHPINVAVKDLLEINKVGSVGKRLPTIDDPYILARLTRGSIGKATSFLEAGPLDFKTLQPVGPGLREILRPAMEANVVQPLRAYLNARHALELTAQGKKTPFPLADAEKVVADANPIVKAAAEQIDSYQGALRKYVQDSGLWSAEQVAAMEKLNPAYVPFFRFIEDPGTVPSYPGGPAVSGKRFANILSPTRKARGGEILPIRDPLESIVRNTYAFVRVADRQAVSDALVRLAEDVPGQDIVRAARAPVRPIDISPEVKRIFKDAEIDISDAALSDLSLAFRPSKYLPPGTIWVNRGGKRQFFQVDEPLYKALLDLGREETPTVIGLLSFPARLLRAGATLSPRFIARNPFRDQFTAAVFSKYGFKPGFDLFKGIFHVMRRDRLYEQFRRSGAEHAALVRTTSLERKNLQRTLDDLLRKDSRLADAWRTTRSPKGWLEGLRTLSETMEEASRSQEFVRALAKTGDPRLAAYAAREVTLDFSRVGANFRVINQIVPFSNANIQGLDKLLRTFRENPQRATALAMTYITLPTMVLYAINHDDPNYNELSSARRDFFWNSPRFKWNDAEGRFERTGEWTSYPKPFDVGMIFGAGAEHAMRWIKDNDPEAFEGFARNLLESFVPTILPTAIVPPIEAATNFSFFKRRSIIPEREKDLLPELQAGPRQGETVRVLGKLLGVSPRILENFVRGYTAGLGEGVLATVDLALSAAGVAGPIEPRSPTERIPLVGPMISQFLVREPTVSSRSVEKFYRTWEQVTEITNSVRLLSKEGRTTEAINLARNTREELDAYPALLQVSQAMAQLQRAMRITRANKNLDREEREEQLRVFGRMYRTTARMGNDAWAFTLKAYETTTPAQQLRPGKSLVPLLAPPGTSRQPQPER